MWTEREIQAEIRCSRLDLTFLTEKRVLLEDKACSLPLRPLSFHDLGFSYQRVPPHCPFSCFKQKSHVATSASYCLCHATTCKHSWPDREGIPSDERKNNSSSGRSGSRLFTPPPPRFLLSGVYISSYLRSLASSLFCTRRAFCPSLVTFCVVFTGFYFFLSPASHLHQNNAFSPPLSYSLFLYFTVFFSLPPNNTCPLLKVF